MGMSGASRRWLPTVTFGVCALLAVGTARAEMAEVIDAPSSASSDCALVKVYYATDRARVDGSDSAAADWTARLACTLAAAGITLIIGTVAHRWRRTRLMRGLTTSFTGVTLVLGIGTAYLYWRDKVAADSPEDAKVVYGSARGNLEMGVCIVAIPDDHEVGHLEAPSILRFDFRENPERHVVLFDVAAQPAEKFYADLKNCVSQSAEKQALVFVHGFNVKFADAVRRTAQFAYDLEFDGAPILYSWPSQGKLSAYTVDEANVEWTTTHLKEFLAEVAKRSGARQVHLIAHSMGNRALASALRDLARGPQNRRPHFGEVVLTAPDIDAEIFKRDMAPAITRIADRVTLYASSNDEALKLSQKVHGSPRAGDTDDELVIVPGVDTIDVSAVDTSLLGHCYYGSNGTVLADLYDLLHENRPPDERQWLQTQYLGEQRYWTFLR